MTLEQVGFYHLERTGPLDVVPSLVDKIYNRGLKSWIYHPDKALLKEMDRVIWTFSQQSFVPHCLEGDESMAHASSILSAQLPPKEGGKIDVFIALAPYAVEEDLPDVSRVVDMFESQDSAVLAQARERWRFYREKEISCAYWIQTSEGKWVQKS